MVKIQKTPQNYRFVVDNNNLWIIDAYYSKHVTHRKNRTLKGSLI